MSMDLTRMGEGFLGDLCDFDLEGKLGKYLLVEKQYSNFQLYICFP